MYIYTPVHTHRHIHTHTHSLTRSYTKTSPDTLKHVRSHLYAHIPAYSGGKQYAQTRTQAHAGDGGRAQRARQAWRAITGWDELVRGCPVAGMF
jgi:hypothetical protein